ncbi:MAG: pectate lyase [Pseudomonadota bacterium]
MSNRSVLLTALLFTHLATAAQPRLAFPGAMGAAATTPGGRGGEIVKVTTLAPAGPGSFLEAVQKVGPRIVVFEVGGVIDLAENTVRITAPNLTIAGQTAPAPGITLIRGGIDIATHDVVVRHIRVRPGDGGRARLSGNDYDAISTLGGAYDVIVDHCTLTWATDENLSASGPRFTGDTPAEWREGTSHRITFSNNIIAEGLATSVHIKGEHSKGSLIHDNVSDILIVDNLYAHDKERSPLFKGGVRGAIINNLIYDPGQRAIHYNLIAEEWGDHPYQTGEMTVIGNVLRGGQSTVAGLPLVTVGGSGDLALYERDNIAVDLWGSPLPMRGTYTTAPIKILKLPVPMLLGVTPMPARAVQDYVVKNAGARNWDRDHEDARVVADTIEGRGFIIDSQSAWGGYPKQELTVQPFDPAKWNLEDMTPR